MFFQLYHSRVEEAARRKAIYASRLAVAEGAVPLTPGDQNAAGEPTSADWHDVIDCISIFVHLTCIYCLVMLAAL